MHLIPFFLLLCHATSRSLYGIVLIPNSKVFCHGVCLTAEERGQVATHDSVGDNSESDVHSSWACFLQKMTSQQCQASLFYTMTDEACKPLVMIRISF
jgi:hypothetical protein